MQTNAVLLVDIGNTRIKYRLLDQADEAIVSTDKVEDVLAVFKQQAIAALYIASVRHPVTLAQLRREAQANGVTVEVVVTEKHAFGLHNSYSDVSKMGADRWLAMIGAMRYTNKPFAVINAGTAITVDFVANGEHLGGWIAPGYNTMQSALVNATTFVTQQECRPDTLLLGKNTESCVTFGCQAALQGVVSMAECFLSERFDDYLLVRTGGDRKLLTKAKSGDNLCAANLVIDGLARYAERALFA